MSEAQQEKPADAWGPPISNVRQRKLQGFVDRWGQEVDHGDRRGPFDNGPSRKGVRLIEADVWWLLRRSARNKYGRLSNFHLEGADLHRVHLSRTDLHGAQLRGADLRGADLRGADLREADLQEAYLFFAHLNRANLSAAYLEGADLTCANLEGADLSWANLEAANLSGAHLSEANLSGARLRGVNLNKAHLEGANLSGANLSGVNLSGGYLERANLSAANLSAANLSAGDLRYATLVGTNFEYAKLSDCKVYGVSAWNLQLEGAVQANLAINASGEPRITVDDLEVAQFLHLMVHNLKIRKVIDTLTSKVVLLLGRFTPERKAVLDALREALRQHNYVPVLFDFEGPESHDFTETVTLLARMARFIIADLTEPSSISQELQAIVPDVMVPVLPLLAEDAKPFAMFVDHRKYPWMLPIYRYANLDTLLAALHEHVIAPAEAKVRALRALRQADAD